MHGEKSFHWLQMIPGWSALTEKFGNIDHIGMVILVALLLVSTFLIARIKLAKILNRADQGVVPANKLTYSNFFEICAEKLYQLTESTIGHHDAPIYFPTIASLFVTIFVCNLIGLVPGLSSPTSNLNTTLALGVAVFLYFNFLGIKEHGLIGYLKHFMGPVLPLAILIFPIELISLFVRPLSLALRLRGNMEGDHLVLGIFSGLVPYFLPIIFYGLGVFVAFVQAFVFTLLTMVYINLSTSHDH